MSVKHYRSPDAIPWSPVLEEGVPAGRLADADRLEGDFQEATVASEVDAVPDWDEVHELVQKGLTDLARQVTAQAPDVRIEMGRTSGRAFFLYSSVTLERSLPQPVELVAGLDFERSGADAVLIRTELVRDEGDLLWQLPPTTVPNQRAAVLAGATQQLNELRRQVGRIRAELDHDAKDGHGP